MVEIREKLLPVEGWSISISFFGGIFFTFSSVVGLGMTLDAINRRVSWEVLKLTNYNFFSNCWSLNFGNEERKGVCPTSIGAGMTT